MSTNVSCRHTSTSFVCQVRLLLSAPVLAQLPAADPLEPYLAVSNPVVVLAHVEVIDGTGNAPTADQTIIIDHGKIAFIGSSASAQFPQGAKLLDLSGHTVYPGLVGMHEHLDVTPPPAQ
jgi:hypothetical protein